MVEGLHPSQLDPAVCRMGAAFCERTPEAQYQEEFYRSSDVVAEGAVCFCPEFVSARPERRVDFFVGSRNWGIEVTRDGNRPATQFSGDYRAWLKECRLEDWILLDFRTTRPIQLHDGM